MKIEIEANKNWKWKIFPHKYRVALNRSSVPALVLRSLRNAFQLQIGRLTSFYRRVSKISKRLTYTYVIL